MHAKVTVADDVVFVGSVNLSRSGESDAENVLEIRSAPLADRLAAFIDEVRGRYPVFSPRVPEASAAAHTMRRASCGSSVSRGSGPGRRARPCPSPPGSSRSSRPSAPRTRCPSGPRGTRGSCGFAPGPAPRRARRSCRAPGQDHQAARIAEEMSLRVKKYRSPARGRGSGWALLVGQRDVQPDRWAPESRAPRLAASIAPGPPPVVTARPRSPAGGRPRGPARTPDEPSGVRAEPNTDTRPPHLGHPHERRGGARRGMRSSRSSSARTGSRPGASRPGDDLLVQGGRHARPLRLVVHPRIRLGEPAAASGSTPRRVGIRAFPAISR